MDDPRGHAAPHRPEPLMSLPTRPSWTTIAPLAAVILLLGAWGRQPGPVLASLLGLVLASAVLAAVHHAEVVAEQVGEPFGSLVLALAVTVIEVALIVTMMLSGGTGAETLARDTVFAAVMITTNLIVGLAISLGVRKGGSGWFNQEGSAGALATVLTVTVLCLVLPSVTTSASGPVFNSSQLVFAGIFSLAAYLLFVVTQTVKHRDFFLPVDSQGLVLDEEHHQPPGRRAAGTSLVLLLLCLVAVVGLAKVVSPTIEQVVASLGFPHAFVGVVISLLVLAPETLAAVRNARRGRLQTSLNLAYGSAMASVGLTIPVLAVLSITTGLPLVLGLNPLHLALLALTAVVSILSVMSGRVVRLHGHLHLVIAAAFVFLAAVP